MEAQGGGEGGIEGRGRRGKVEDDRSIQGDRGRGRGGAWSREEVGKEEGKSGGKKRMGARCVSREIGWKEREGSEREKERKKGGETDNKELTEVKKEKNR